MAHSSLYKRLISFVFAFALLALLCFGTLAVWVITGPRSLNALTPYIESALASSGSDYKIRIESSLLIWDGWTHPVGIRVRNVDLLDNHGASIAHFPEVGVRMYFFELLMGKIDLKSIELLSPVIKLVQDSKGNLTSFGFSNDATGSNAPLPVALALLTSGQGDTLLTNLKSFIIRHASLSVKDNHGVTFLASPDASIEITRQQGTASGRVKMPLQFGGKRSEIDIRFKLNGNNRTVSSDVVFSDVPSAVLHALAPTQKWMDGVNVPLSGWAEMTSDFDANINTIDFSLETGSGTINFPEQFEHVLKPERIKVTGTLTDGLKTFTVKEGELDFPGHSLTFNGTAHKVGDDYGVDGYAVASSVAVDDIHDYWPLTLSPHSRHWVTTHMSKGKVIKADVTLHFKPGEFRLKDTPEAAVDSTIALKGATINYKPGHPPVTDVEGTVRFTGKIMDARITGARYMEDTRITAAHVRFPDFYPDDVRLFIDMNLEASARDVHRFLSLPDLDKASKLGLTANATGQASGNAKLDFIAFSENDKDDVAATGKINYSINADLKDVTQDHFMGNRDVANAFMKLLVDNKGLKLSGKARINNVPMNIDLISGFRKNDTTYAIKANMPVARLPDFGLPELSFAKGVMGVNATLHSSGDEERADAVLDLTQTAIQLPKQDLDKKAGEKASLTLSTEKLPSGNTLIKSFTLKGDGYNVAGTAEYDEAANDFSRFSLAPVQLGKMDLDTLAYEKKGNVVHLSGQGRAFNLSHYLADSPDKKTDLAYIIDLHASRLILGDDREVSDVAVQADCPADACRAAHIAAKLKDGTPFTYAIASDRLESSCDNAGELLRTLGIFDTIDGGKMLLTGQYNAGRLEGALEVKDYTLKKAPVLTKIFTIASLTGILDTLTGNGIYFDRLSAPFVYHRGILIFKGAKAHGSALGLTADGVIDINKSTLALSGVLVPSYTLNSLIGHIPLIGDLITGGSGKGLLALSYSLSGDMKDPSIQVNPLSVLTPGFLRNIFNIFDKPEPDMSAIEAAQKKASEPPPAAVPAAPAVSAPSDSTLPSLDELKK